MILSHAPKLILSKLMPLAIDHLNNSVDKEHNGMKRKKRKKSVFGAFIGNFIRLKVYIIHKLFGTSHF